MKRKYFRRFGMQAFFHGMDIETLLASYGYIAVLFFTFVEGETVVVLAGVAAAHGVLDPYRVALCAFCGSLCSDQLMFFLGRYRGESILRYIPGLEPRLARVTDLMRRYDTALILGFRFIYGIRNVMPIMLGVSGVSRVKFILLNLPGAAIWAALCTAGGYYLGQAFISVAGRAGESLALFLLAVLAAAALVHLFHARRLKRR